MMVTATIYTQQSQELLSEVKSQHRGELDDLIRYQRPVNFLELISYFEYRIHDHREYINENDIDPEDITNWEWSR